VEGRDAITKMWSSLLASGIRSLALTAVEVTGGGDTAQEVGTYLLKTPDGSVADEGKYIVLWKKDGGRWRLHRDIWNSNAPAARP
jgi:ketosteroid isomerase-like protein